MKKVSIIIPVYNVIDFLPETLKSVVAQSFRDFEVLLVNDGSKPEVSRRLLELCAQYPFMEMLELDRHKGVSHARNAGIVSAKGDFLLFLDADDRIHPDHLKNCVEFLNRHPEADSVIIDAEVFAKEDTPYVQKQTSYFERSVRKFQKTGPDDPFYFLVFIPPIHAFLFRKNVFKQARFEETLTYGEDRMLWLELRHRGIKFGKLKFTGAFYRLRPEAVPGKTMVQTRFFERLRKSGLITGNRAISYVHTMLWLLNIRRGAFVKTIFYSFKLLSAPVNAVRNLLMVRRLRK